MGDDVNSYKCNECPSGKVAQAGDTKCKDCIAGLFQSNTGQGTCEACGAGTWSVQLRMHVQLV